MKAMKFFNSEKDHFTEKTFSNIEQKTSKVKYINFRDRFACYNQSINWTSI